MRPLHYSIMPIWLLALGAVAACGEDKGEAGHPRPECNRACQQANDHYIDEYHDYFVSDSEGDKDGIVAVYYGIPSGFEGIECTVFKTFDDGNTANMSVVCPGLNTFSAPSSTDIEEEG